MPNKCVSTPTAGCAHNSWLGCDLPNSTASCIPLACCASAPLRAGRLTARVDHFSYNTCFFLRKMITWKNSQHVTMASGFVFLFLPVFTEILPSRHCLTEVKYGLPYDASYSVFSPWKFTSILLKPYQPVDLFCHSSVTTSSDQETFK